MEAEQEKSDKNGDPILEEKVKESPETLIPRMYSEQKLAYIFKNQEDAVKLWSLKIQKFGQKMVKNLRTFYKRIENQNDLLGVKYEKSL